MTLKVVPLNNQPPQADIVGNLRNLADRIEAGDIEMSDISTVVCVLGHSYTKLLPDGDQSQSCEWDRYAWGRRTDPFVTRGLLATVLKST